MHLHCNGIKYNVSKGLVARGREELGMIWHCIGTWQGQTTRCSHDVAAVENQEGLGGGCRDCARGRKGCLMIVSILLLFFSNIFMFFFQIHKHYLPAAGGQDVLILFLVLLGCLASLHVFMTSLLSDYRIAHVEGTQGREVCLRKSPEKQQLVTLL